MIRIINLASSQRDFRPMAQKLTLSLIITSALALSQTSLGQDRTHHSEALQVHTGTLTAGPWFGRGVSSDSTLVTQAAGFALGSDLWLKEWDKDPTKWAVAPRIELANGLVSTESRNDESTSVTHYDHRIVALGLSLRRQAGSPATFAQGVYLNIMGGQSLSILSRGETSQSKFSSSEIKNVSGSVMTVECGTWIPVKRNFGVNLGFLYSQHQLDQSKAQGLTDTRQTDPSGAVLNLTSPADTTPLARKVVQRTAGAKVSLVLGF
jgi:hypothetical protein